MKKKIQPCIKGKGCSPIDVEWLKNTREEHYGIRCLKKSAHLLGYDGFLSRPSIEITTILIKKQREKMTERVND